MEKEDKHETQTFGGTCARGYDDIDRSFRDGAFEACGGRTQKPEKSVVDAAGATWYHADAGEELRFDDDSSYCFESESWIMRQKSGNTIDEAVFDGITPDNVQTLTDENGETYTVSMYSQATDCCSTQPHARQRNEKTRTNPC